MEKIEVTSLISYFENSLPGILEFALNVLIAFVCFILGSFLIKTVRKLIRKSFLLSKIDVGVAQFLDSLLKFVLYMILIVSIATKFGVDTASVAALIASLGVAVGLALQGSLSNLAGGILILLLKPFIVGDYIIEDNKKNEGIVKEIQIFYTKLLTSDNKIIVIPNGTLATNSLTNVTARNKKRIEILLYLSHHADIDMVKEKIECVIKNEQRIIKDCEKWVGTENLEKGCTVMNLHVWVSAEDYVQTRSDLLEILKRNLQEELL